MTNLSIQSIVKTALATGYLSPDHQQLINQQFLYGQVSPEDMQHMDQLEEALLSGVIKCTKTSCDKVAS
ncbi:MAG: hypothetical protein HC921_00500 [Synechococcaceae cyanobacterium SM2_3_1]|nr:hypothetical protein [Synechococcaceae cyanobacterium SM2_3_1]